MQLGIKKFSDMSIGTKIQLAIAINVVLGIFLGHYIVQDFMQITGGTGLLVNVGMNLGICIVYGYIVSRAIIKPLRSATLVMQDIAEGEGDLTKRLDVESQDETGQLATNFNLFLDKLQMIISDVAQATEQLATSSEQLTVSTSRTVAATQSQQQETNSVLDKMTHMSTQIHGVNQNTSEASVMADEANEQAKSGAMLAVEAMCGIDNLVSEIDEVSQDVTNLQESSESIGSVVEVITNIAEQTNLLALNAAIEAARAGEQGRGFAVVADEVRTLANRTQASTQEINSIIEALQSRTNHAVDVMRKATAQAQEEAKKVEETAESLGEIAGSVSQITGMNQKITQATSEQSSLMVEVDQSLQSMNGISERTTQDAQESNQIGTNLADIASNLKHMVGQFKL